MVVFWNISRERDVINTYKKGQTNGACVAFYTPPITKKELKKFLREVIKDANKSKKKWMQYLWN